MVYVRMRCILLQDLPELVKADTGVLDNGLEQARSEHLPGMHGNSHTAAALWMPELNVRAALDNDRPPETLECSDEFGTRDARKARHGREQ